MTITMFDSISPSAIPSLASTSHDAVAGYVDGRWADFAELERRFPKDHHLSIAVTSADNADCLDIETGDAVAWQAPGWVRRQHARGVARPVLYANLSTMPSVISALNDAGLSRQSYRLWAAHYTYDLAVANKELEQGYDAVQWTDKAQGRDLDESVCKDSFFQQVAPPKPKPRPKRKRQPVKKVKKIVSKVHPKVAASTAAAAISTEILKVLTGAGVTVNSGEHAAVVALAVLVVGYLTPARKPAG